MSIRILFVACFGLVCQLCCSQTRPAPELLPSAPCGELRLTAQADHAIRVGSATGARMQGQTVVSGTEAVPEASVGNVPLLLRAGSIVPLGQIGQYAGNNGQRRTPSTMDAHLALNSKNEIRDSMLIARSRSVGNKNPKFVRR